VRCSCAPLLTCPRRVGATLLRNPQAFRPKIGLNSGAAGQHNRGCHCKKSGCLKKYCECFQAGISCSDVCKCSDCKNRNGANFKAVRALTRPRAVVHLHAAAQLPPTALAPAARPQGAAETPSSSAASPQPLGSGMGAKRPRTEPGAPGSTPLSRTGASDVSTPGLTAEAQAAHANSAAPSRSVGLAPVPDTLPANSPLQLARTAIAQSIDDAMLAELCRGTLVDADLRTHDAHSNQQQEYRLLSVLHASLHHVLAAARAAPQQHAAGGGEATEDGDMKAKAHDSSGGGSVDVSGGGNGSHVTDPAVANRHGVTNGHAEPSAPTAPTLGAVASEASA
jgi:hypothetical protein